MADNFKTQSKAQSQDAFNPVKLLTIVWKRKLIVILITLIGTAGTWYYTSKLIRAYISQASLLIESPSSGLSDQPIPIKVEVSRSQAVLAESEPVKKRAEELSGEKFTSNAESPIAPTFEAHVEEQLLYLQVIDGNPIRASKFANAWAQAFVEEMARRALMPKVTALNVMEKSLPDLKNDFKNKEDALRAFERDNDFDPREFEQHPLKSLIHELEGKVNSKNLEIAQLTAEKEVVEKKKDSPLELLELPRARQDTVLQAMPKQLQERRAELETALLTYKPDSPEVTRIKARISEIEQDVQNAINSFSRRISLEVEIAQNERDQLAKLLDDANKKFEVLKTKAQKYQALSDSANRAKEALQVLERQKAATDTSLSYANSYARLWEDAHPNFEPIRPAWRKNMVTGVFASLFAAIFLVCAIEFLDERVRTTNELSGSLGVQNLGLVPTLTLKSADRDGYFAVRNKGCTYFSDCIRNVQIAIDLELGKNANYSTSFITVTSSLPKEGKSFLCSNLAATFAASRRVLLIDADTRKGTLTRAANMVGRPGLLNIIAMQKWDSRLAQETEVPNCFILPAGTTPREPDGRPQTLSLSSIKDIVAQIRSEFEMVIFDTPPVLAMADAILMASITDITLLVVRSRQSRMIHVHRSVSTLQQAKCKKLCTIVNGVAEADAKADYYYYSHAGYGFDSADSQSRKPAEQR